MQEIHGGDIYRNKVNLDFSVNTNPLGIPKSVEIALYEAVTCCHEYPDIAALKLKETVANLLSIPKEYLLFGNGASEVFMGIMHALRPKSVIIPVPSFYGYKYVAEAVESKIIYFPLKKENLFLPQKEFLEMLTEDIDLLFLANPNNPTGKLIDHQYLKSVLDLCREKNIYVVLDECFISFCKGELSFLSKIDEYPNLLLVQAFTKIYAIPGVRLGYLVSSNTSLIQKIRKQFPEWNLSVFAQEAGIVCAHQMAYVEKTVEYVKKEREFLSAHLQEMGIQVFSSDANFILIYSEKLLYELLLKRGILIRDCENFRGLSKGYYRIAVKSRKENEILLKEIGECIA